MRAVYIQFYDPYHCTLVHVYMKTINAWRNKSTSKGQNRKEPRRINSATYRGAIELNGASAPIPEQSGGVEIAKLDVIESGFTDQRTVRISEIVISIICRKNQGQIESISNAQLLKNFCQVSLHRAFCNCT